MKRSENFLSVREMVLFGILGAMTFGAKYIMSFLPNIEPVSLCVMLYALVFGKKWVYPVYTYVALEILFYGLGIWNLNYLYTWAILALMTRLLKDMDGVFGWALLAGVFGLAFGALCGIVDVCMGGWAYAVTKWISGIPFDLSHCAGNFVMTLVLFKPLRKLLEKQYQRMTNKR